MGVPQSGSGGGKGGIAVGFHDVLTLVTQGDAIEHHAGDAGMDEVEHSQGAVDGFLAGDAIAHHQDQAVGVLGEQLAVGEEQHRRRVDDHIVIG